MPSRAWIALLAAGVLGGCGHSAAPARTPAPYGVLARPWRSSDRMPAIYDRDPLAIDRESHFNRRLGDFDLSTYYLGKTAKRGEWCFTQFNRRYRVTAGLCLGIFEKKGLAPVNSVLTPTGPGTNNLLSAVLVPDGYTVTASDAHVWRSYRSRNLAVFIVSKSVRFTLRGHNLPILVKTVPFHKADLNAPRR